MHLNIIRQPSAKGATISRWYVSADGVAPAPTVFCYGCEDVVRPPGQYVHGQTAIPAGTYRVDITYSNRFKRLLPLLVDLPGKRTLFGGRPIGECGIRIHSGNTQDDTDGCLLPGAAIGPDKASVTSSRQTFERLFARLEQAHAAGETITLTIS